LGKMVVPAVKEAISRQLSAFSKTIHAFADR
jgi:hypothetical protein